MRYAQQRRERSDAADEWLVRLLGDAGGAALVAVGGYGRRQLSPGSDLDVVLLHDGSRDSAAIGQLADSIWYPIWDAKTMLDHSVRTVAEARAVAQQDLPVALGMLTARHVAGDPALTEALRAALLADWRKHAPKRLPELRRLREERRERHGELAYRLEGDLKECAGGLRDADSLTAIAASWIADVPHGAPEQAQEFLLDVRWALHTRTGRSADRLLLQEQDDLAAELDFESADDLMTAVSDAARTIDYACDVAWRRVDQALATRTRSTGISGLLRRAAPEREPLADGVVRAEGEAALALAANLDDPVLPLRIAAAAARAGLPIAPASLERLASSGAALTEPWPEPARAELLRLLGSGPGLVQVWEELDRTGLLVRLLPEWERIRSLPQRNALHVHTVDRHIIETVVHAAERARRVARPDLLLAAALCHDLGKGLPGDHCVTGAELTVKLAARLGFPPADVATLTALTRHHLLFAELAVHRDPTDPATLAPLLAAAADSGTNPADFVALLHLLTESDSQATGPAVWSPWRASLYRELAARANTVLAGGTSAAREAAAAHAAADADETLVSQAALAQDRIAVQALAPGSAGIGRIDVAIPDDVGVLALVAGVLTLRHIRVLGAEINTVEASGTAYAVQRWTVAAEYGSLPDLGRLRTDLRSARLGTLKLAERLEARDRERLSSRRQAALTPPASVRLLAGASHDATVLEVRAEDSPGLLHRIASAIAGIGADITRARIATLGPQAVDVFYLRPDAGAEAVGSAAAEELVDAVHAALS
ncbi:[protein-PII] uridylyltransferase [Actinospica durhamensis]|uniref:Bifunctional uridylyltransferase/uridylyl-removing enzyme n=2 Tax=Actinospica durhamensis TaxID=1508375 RepID=A0A941ETP6_9ACTN|nr:[protein-PII] uridylyltransferase [Actinospica durhamensis]